jgi:hypothetical protein
MPCSLRRLMERKILDGPARMRDRRKRSEPKAIDEVCIEWQMI